MKLTAQQKKILNGLLREVCFAREGERCLRCKSTQRLQLSHIYPKGKYRRMEYDDRNVKILCYACHFHFWHKNPMEAKDWLSLVLPAERIQYLRLRAGTIDKSPFDYKLEKLYLEKTLKSLKKSATIIAGWLPYSSSLSHPDQFPPGAVGARERRTRQGNALRRREKRRSRWKNPAPFSKLEEGCWCHQ